RGTTCRAPTFICTTPLLDLRQLPDLDAVPREHRDEAAFPLRIVADVRRARDAGDHLHLVAGFVARHRRVIVTGREDPVAHHHHAVVPPGPLGEHTGRLVAGFPCK